MTAAKSHMLINGVFGLLLGVLCSFCSFSQCLNNIFSTFRYVSIGDIAHVGSHPPNVAAVYHNIDRQFALPVGYDLVKIKC